MVLLSNKLNKKLKTERCYSSFNHQTKTYVIPIALRDSARPCIVRQVLYLAVIVQF